MNHRMKSAARFHVNAVVVVLFSSLLRELPATWPSGLPSLLCLPRLIFLVLSPNPVSLSSCGAVGLPAAGEPPPMF